MPFASVPGVRVPTLAITLLTTNAAPVGKPEARLTRIAQGCAICAVASARERRAIRWLSYRNKQGYRWQIVPPTVGSSWHASTGDLGVPVLVVTSPMRREFWIGAKSEIRPPLSLGPVGQLGIDCVARLWIDQAHVAQCARHKSGQEDGRGPDSGMNMNC